MPDIGKELIAYLKTKTPITDIIGSGPAARIYENIVKQSVPSPFVVIVVFTNSSAEHLTGVSGIGANRVEINCYANTSDQAFELAEAIRLAPLQAWRGQMGNAFVTSVTSDIGYDRGYDPLANAGDTKRYYVSRDYTIYYSEPVTN